ncbi:MAG TPA: TetR/AcrR family transcriptional regulator [Candidatus Sericytochromatia bacterium]|jgi:AcrR family transcriptional regulator
MVGTKTNRTERQLSPEKAEAILEGAMQEFLAHGYAATSMDKVAVAAGVSKATVYSHFKDKEGLFTAIIQQLAEKKTSILHLNDLQTLECEPSVVLRQMATNMLDFTTNDQQFLCFVRLIIGESGRFPELARAFVYNFDLSGCAVLGQYLASHPELKISDPNATARVFIGALVHFVITQEMMHGKDVVPLERERLVNSLIELIASTNDRH